MSLKDLKEKLQMIQSQSTRVSSAVANIVMGVAHELDKLTDDDDDDDGQGEPEPLESPRVVQDD